MEWEADNLAFEYISHSPYNPGATAAVWQRLIDLEGNNSANVFAVMSGAADHPSNSSRRDNYAKKLTEMSGGRVVVKNGVVYVNQKEFVMPAPAGDMSSAERSYFVAGNLAAAFKNGEGSASAYANHLLCKRRHRCRQSRRPSEPNQIIRSQKSPPKKFA